MSQNSLYQKILASLKDSSLPVQVRLADRPTQERIARRLAELLQAQPPRQKQPLQTTFSALSADKYD